MIIRPYYYFEREAATVSFRVHADDAKNFSLLCDTVAIIALTINKRTIWEASTWPTIWADSWLKPN